MKKQRGALEKENAQHKQQVAEMKLESEATTLQLEHVKEELQKLQLEHRLLKTTFDEVALENNFRRQENESLATENQQLKNVQLSEKFKTNRIVAKQLSSCHREMRELFVMMQKFKSEKDVDLSHFIGCDNDQTLSDNKGANKYINAAVIFKFVVTQGDGRHFHKNP